MQQTLITTAPWTVERERDWKGTIFLYCDASLPENPEVVDVVVVSSLTVLVVSEAAQKRRRFTTARSRGDLTSKTDPGD